MLAQTFKTPADLYLDDKEFEALVKVMRMLESGEIVYRSSGSKEVGFNMMEWHNECNTVHCIAGLCDHLFGTAFTHGCPNRALEDLFLVRWWDATRRRRTAPAPLNWISEDEAAMAIRNYLSTGDARWNEVLEV